MMSRLQKGFIAGFAATAVVSVVDLIAGIVQTTIGERWFYSFPTLVAAMMRSVAGEGANQLWVGWAVHFVVGTFLLGGLFALLAMKLPTETPATKGIVFAVGAWLVMCLTVMPMAGMGAFGALATGFPTVAWMLATHVVFGIVLGRVYFRLHGEVGHPSRIKPMAA